MYYIASGDDATGFTVLAAIWLGLRGLDTVLAVINHDELQNDQQVIDGDSVVCMLPMK